MLTAKLSLAGRLMAPGFNRAPTGDRFSIFIVELDQNWLILNCDQIFFAIDCVAVRFFKT